jgi:hypothetical protein
MDELLGDRMTSLGPGGGGKLIVAAKIETYRLTGTLVHLLRGVILGSVGIDCLASDDPNARGMPLPCRCRLWVRTGEVRHHATCQQT